MRSSRNYVLEFNRCRGDSIRRVEARLNKRGIPARIVPHKTTVRAQRPDGMGWTTFKDEVRMEMGTRRTASVLIHSQRTGHTYLCRRGGNRPRKFEQV